MKIRVLIGACLLLIGCDQRVCKNGKLYLKRGDIWVQTYESRNCLTPEEMESK